MTGPVVGFLIGLYEAGWLGLTDFRNFEAYGFQTYPKLFIAGALTYGILGLLFSLPLAALFSIFTRRKESQVLQSRPGLFLIVGILTCGVAFNSLIVVNKAVLAWIPLIHWISLSVTAGILCVSFFVGLLLFRLLQNRFVGRGNTAMMLGLLLPRKVFVPLFKLTGLLFLATLVAGVVFPKEVRTAAIIEPLNSVEASLPTPEGAPNFLLITIETLREDFFEVLDPNHPEYLPQMGEFAKGATVFSNYFTQATSTKPSMTSMFTSLYPSQHRVREVGARLSEYGQALPEVLARYGFKTRQFSGNRNATQASFGFQEAEWEFIADPKEQVTLTSFGLFFLGERITQVLNAYHLDLKPVVDTWYYSGERILNRARPWWDSRGSDPWFLNLHFYDPHHPYLEQPDWTFFLNTERPWNRENLVRRYKKEIQYTDTKVGELLSWLDESGEAENTVVIITVDHGEEFYEHKIWRHGRSVYEPVMHVPFMIRWPNKIPAGKVVEAQGRSIDIAPTVMEILGLESPEVWQGSSLLPLIDGTDERPRPVITQQEMPSSAFTSLRLPHAKLIVTTGANEGVELYLIDQDPEELRNVAEEQPELLAQMKDRLADMLSKIGEFQLDSAAEEHSAKELEVLSAMGYMDEEE